MHVSSRLSDNLQQLFQLGLRRSNLLHDRFDMLALERSLHGIVPDRARARPASFERRMGVVQQTERAGAVAQSSLPSPQRAA
jgi:hypothetical protein